MQNSNIKSLMPLDCRWRFMQLKFSLYLLFLFAFFLFFPYASFLRRRPFFFFLFVFVFFLFSFFCFTFFFFVFVFVFFFFVFVFFFFLFFFLVLFCVTLFLISGFWSAFPPFFYDLVALMDVRTPCSDDLTWPGVEVGVFCEVQGRQVSGPSYLNSVAAIVTSYPYPCNIYSRDRLQNLQSDHIYLFNRSGKYTTRTLVYGWESPALRFYDRIRYIWIKKKLQHIIIFFSLVSAQRNPT